MSSRKKNSYLFHTYFLEQKHDLPFCHNSEPEDQNRGAEPFLLFFVATIANLATHQDPTCIRVSPRSMIPSQ